MSPQQRLDSILGSASVRAFAPFGVQRPAVCFSESPPEHMGHLVADLGFPPWGIVVSRSAFVANGGGAVAYLPDYVRNEFPPDLRHWVVPFTTDGRLGDWSHEREWRLPMPKIPGSGDYHSAIGFRDTTVLEAVLSPLRNSAGPSEGCRATEMGGVTTHFDVGAAEPPSSAAKTVGPALVRPKSRWRTQWAELTFAEVIALVCGVSDPMEVTGVLCDGGGWLAVLLP